MIASGSGEQAEGGVVAESGVDGEGWSDAPGIFCVEAKAAERLGKGAVAGIGVGAGGIGKSGGRAIVVCGELGGIAYVEGRIFGELDQMLGSGGEGTAEYRFVNEIYPKAKSVA